MSSSNIHINNLSNNQGHTSSSNNQNMLPKISKQVNAFLIFIIFGFVLTTILALYTPSLFTSTNGIGMTQEMIAVNITLITVFILIITGLLIYFLPGLSDVKKFISQFTGVLMVILYTIFTILFFRLLPSNIMDQYGMYITPSTMLISIVLFYFGFNKNYMKDFNVNYERIKSVILFLCFITTLFVYYSSNTGGFVQQFFGSSLIITILLAFFSFLYILIVLTIPDDGFPSRNQGPTNFLNMFTSFSAYGTILFVIYLILVVCGIIYLQGGFSKSNATNNTNTNNNNNNGNITNPYYGETNYVVNQSTDTYNQLNSNYQDTNLNSMFNTPPSENASELTFSFNKANSKNNYSFAIPLPNSYATNYATNLENDVTNGQQEGNGSISFNQGIEGFTDMTSGQQSQTLAMALIFVLLTTIIFAVALIINLFPDASPSVSINVSTFQRSLLVIFGVILSGLLIGWIVYYSQHLTGQSSVVSFVLNLLLVLVILILIYKTFIVTFPVGNSRKSGFFNLMFNLLLYIPCLFSDLFSAFVSIFTGQNYSDLASSVLLIIIATLLLIAYFELPSIESKVALQGGQLIINKPVNLNNLSPLANYQDLNGNTDAKYEYGISAWFFIDSMPPNTNTSYNAYTSILNYGNKPNISYNPSENKLRVTMEKITRTVTPNTSSGTKRDYTDTSIQEILYEKEKILLQKWNNIIVNYTGGTLDVFLNNELMKSVNGIVPYMKLDSLTTGQENGLMGGICNVVYFKAPITSPQMYYLYNTVKNKTPPIADNSNKTIIPVSK
jgi:hypothetical protein